MKASMKTHGIEEDRFIAKLVSAWASVLDAYEEQTLQKGDAAYLHGERACVGHLATAAHLVGAASIQEFGAEYKEEKKTWPRGRIDLMVFNSQAKERILIEAKYFQYPHGLKHLNESLNYWIDELNQVLTYELNDRLKIAGRWGVLFAVPNIKQREVEVSGGVTDELIDEVWKSVMANHTEHWNHVAFYVAKHPSEIMMNRRYFPGVFLIIREYDAVC
jgi:hypothetical protein